MRLTSRRIDLHHLDIISINVIIVILSATKRYANDGIFCVCFADASRSAISTSSATRTDIDMAKTNANASGRNTVNLGPREWEAASQMTMEFDSPSVAVTVRMCVTSVTALNNAEKLGFKAQLLGADGRRYSYSLKRPKVAFELDARGIETGRFVDLIAVLSPAEKPKPTRLKAIKGGKALEKV